MAHIDTSAIIRGSIWIPPTGEALHKIDEAMRVVRKRVGGPRIKPHLTLLMGIETTQQRAAAESACRGSRRQHRCVPRRKQCSAYQRDC